MELKRLTNLFKQNNWFNGLKRFEIISCKIRLKTKYFCGSIIICLQYNKSRGCGSGLLVLFIQETHIQAHPGQDIPTVIMRLLL
jgi:hypothetical protein